MSPSKVLIYIRVINPSSTELQLQTLRPAMVPNHDLPRTQRRMPIGWLGHTNRPHFARSRPKFNSTFPQLVAIASDGRTKAVSQSDRVLGLQRSPPPPELEPARIGRDFHETISRCNLQSYDHESNLNSNSV